ncbi:hypothetical protein SH668x_001353 [Planctomicrobium sp. SH668]|uniref:hypothetical protein n=1 Tax=Planctomicrobium sp. SH668 TaxID=3448126 RepID=UPI003F5CA262
MSDSKPSYPPSNSSQTITFPATAYRADGTLYLGPALQVIGALGILGIILGVIAGFISNYFYLIMLFPLAMGFIVGFFGSYLVKKFHLRNPLLCGLAGFLAGAFTMVAMHYTSYYQTQNELKKAFPGWLPMARTLAQNLEQINAKDKDTEIPEEIQLFIKELESNPDLRGILAADTFPKFLDFQAKQGVEIKKGNGNRNGKGFNLGYTGTYTYWLLEALIVAGISFSMMNSSAGEPYCTKCDTWKTAGIYGPFADAQAVSSDIKEGKLSPFPAAMEDAKKFGMITLHSCPSCTDQSDVDVLVENWKIQKNDAVHKYTLAHMTFPPESLPVFQTILATSPIPMNDPSAIDPQS